MVTETHAVQLATLLFRPLFCLSWSKLSWVCLPTSWRVAHMSWPDLNMSVCSSISLSTRLFNCTIEFKPALLACSCWSELSGTGCVLAALLVTITYFLQQYLGGTLADAMQEDMQWATELPGNTPAFCIAAVGTLERHILRDFILGFLLAAHVASHVCYSHLPHFSDMVWWAKKDPFCLSSFRIDSWVLAHPAGQISWISTWRWAFMK